MGTWSITPSSSIASIDNNGRATFGNHDSTVTYIIKYQGDDCGTLTTSFTVYKCETPSTCTCGDLTVGGKTVSAEGGSNKVVAKYTAGCVTNIGASSDKDWVTITSTSGGEIKATVGAYTDTTQDRTATITITGTSDNGNCSKQATLTQSKQGGATCDCNTANITNAAGATLESRAYTNPTSVATFNAASCVSEMTVKRVSGGDFLSDFDIESSSSNYSIVAKASENTSTTQERSEIIGIYIDDTKCKEITVKQAEKKETDTISFRGRNCNAEYGTIKVVSITLSDGSTVSCNVAESVNAGGEEHLGTVDVTGKTGKSITSANVTFNDTSIGSAGISGTISDGAEFTATAGNCGGGCQYPGDSIQIWLTGLTNSYEYYVLTDEVIGTVCQNWVMSHGHKYYPSEYGLSLGYYQYNGCSLTSYDSGENNYCDIATPGSASCDGYNRGLSASTSYHLYGFNGSGFTEIRTVWMPDGSTAQSGADSQKQYKV